MAVIKISALPAAAALDGSELVPIVQSGVTVQSTTQDIADLAVSSGGTVTSVSVTTANGVSGSVATATTTPAITLTLGAITPSSVAAVGTVTGSNLSGTNTGDQTNISGNAATVTTNANLTGPVTSTGNATAVTNNAITNAMLAQMAAHTFKGNNTASTANSLDLTATELTAELDVFSSALKGLAPSSGGGTSNYLRADGTWSAPPGATAGTVTSVSVTTANGVSGSVATSTTTPAISLTLGAITPSSVAAVGTVTGSNLSGTNTGDQTITLTGNVTGSGTGSFATTIANSVVTYTKIQDVSATDKILGRSTAGSGVVEEITCTAAGRALLDDADASAQRTTLGLGTLATQSGTFSGTSSGTNTGDQNLFSTIAVSGQSNVVADTTSDTLTLVAGTNITITTDASTDAITINAGGGSGTVTSVSVTTANGVSGSVATATTTPAITLTLGAITPSSVAAVGTVTGSNLSGTNTGDQTITLTGNVTGSGTGSFSATIANDAVTYAKMQNVSATDKVLGRSTAGSGDVEEISCTAAGRALLDDADATAQRTTLGLGTLATQSGTFSGTSSGTNTGDQTITLTGNVTGSGTGSFAATIANSAVTYAKIQNVSATDKILGRSTAGSGVVEEITCTAAGRALLDDATASDQRSTLGLSIGSNVQAYDADLTALANLTSAADRLPYFTGPAAAALAVFTAAGRAILDDADASAQRTTLGLAIGTNVQAYDADLAAIAGLTSAADTLPYFTGSGTASLATFTAAGRALVDDASAAAQVTTLGLDNTKIASVGITIDGGGSAISTGLKGYIEVPYACTINRVTMLADQSGSIVVDIWKDTYANFPPLVADTITASAKPTISAATKSQDSTLTGWTTSVAAGDILAFNVNSASTITRLNLILKVTKT